MIIFSNSTDSDAMQLYRFSLFGIAGKDSHSMSLAEIEQRMGVRVLLHSFQGLVVMTDLQDLK